MDAGMFWDSVLKGRDDPTLAILRSVRADSALTEWLSGLTPPPRTKYSIGDGVAVLETVRVGRGALGGAVNTSPDVSAKSGAKGDDLTVRLSYCVPCACTDDGWMLGLGVTLEFDWVLREIGARPARGESEARIVSSRNIIRMKGAPTMVNLHHLASGQIILEVHTTLPSGVVFEDRALYNGSGLGDECETVPANNAFVARMVQQRAPTCMFCQSRGELICSCPVQMSQRLNSPVVNANPEVSVDDLKDCWARFSAFLNNFTHFTAAALLSVRTSIDTAKPLPMSRVDDCEDVCRMSSITSMNSSYFPRNTDMMSLYKLVVPPDASLATARLRCVQAERLAPLRVHELLLCGSSDGKSDSFARSAELRAMEAEKRSASKRKRASLDSSQRQTCELCGSTFRHRGHLNEHHRLVHLKQRNFECPHCGRHFSTRANCKAHVRRKHEDTPAMACDVCGRIFKCKYKLRTHASNVHHSVRSSSAESIRPSLVDQR